MVHSATITSLLNINLQAAVAALGLGAAALGLSLEGSGAGERTIVMARSRYGGVRVK